MQSVLGTKRGKTCNQCLTREKLYPVPSAGEIESCAKREEIFTLCQARENLYPVLSGGKIVTGAKNEKNSIDVKRGKLIKQVVQGAVNATKCA